MPRPPSTGRVTDGFGPRESPGGIGSSYHLGEDRIGDGNYSPVSGDLVFAGYVGGWGWIFGIRENDERVWWVAHNATLAGCEYRHYDLGEYVAPLGSSGNSTGPHSHTELRIGGRNYPGTGVAVDPAPYYTAATSGGSTTPPPPRSEEETMFIKAVGETFHHIPTGWMFEMAQDGTLRALSVEEQSLVLVRERKGLLEVSEWKASDIYNHEIKSGLWEFTGSVTGNDPGFHTGYLLFGMPTPTDNMRRLPGEPYPIR